MTPEQKARQQIDKMLTQAGWVIQDLKQFSPNAALGVVVREYPTESGPADYVMFVDRNPIGIIEAKDESKGETLIVAEGQTERYASSQLKWIKNKSSLPFLYQSTGTLTRFTDNRDPKPRSREIFQFHKPETLLKWINETDTLRHRLTTIPPLNIEGLRECQVNAIENLECSFALNNPRALIQMATGSGKTFTAITSVYRLLKYAKAKRILFLVDTRNLGVQAEQEFQAFEPSDDKRKFTELYNVQRLTSKFIDKDSQVCISTIQRMYSILRGEELDESAETESLYEIKQVDRPKDVAYNSDVPVEMFDFIIIDECHRSIYNLWKQVLDYFDAFLIGLTATPDKRTFGFFNQNVVSEYYNEKAVADGVNVSYDVYKIDTNITKHGAKIEAKQWIDKRDRLSRRKKWEILDEDVIYSNVELDRDVVNPSQIRTIIRAFKESVQTSIFPGRKEVPKTLIFAKSDSHADDIIKIVREEFAEGNAFCKKVTYNNTEENSSTVLQQFRNEYNPRVAVTVDMIATGTDVKPIECLIFMRDVKSRSYFQQMIGRGTRTMDYDSLKTITPSVTGSKTHFVVIDAIGVCESVKIDSRPLERKPGISLKDLMMNVVLGTRDEDTITSLANRLTRLERQITPQEKEKAKEINGGKTIGVIVAELLGSFDPDKVAEKAKTLSPVKDGEEIPEEILKQANDELAKEASAVFDDAKFREYIENVRKKYEQIIDTVNIDEVTGIGWSGKVKEKAVELVNGFKEFIEANKDEITALQIFYSQPYRRRELTFKMIKELCDVLKQTKPNLAPLHVWNAYEQIESVNGSRPLEELTALVALVRHAINIDNVLTNYDVTVNKNFQEWVFKKQAGALKFTKEQMDWLRMIKEHAASSVHIEKDDFDNTPFAEHGGLAKAYMLFGDELDSIINELNEALAA